MEPFYTHKNITIYHGDTLEVMAYLREQEIIVDMICADLPYGITDSSWDSVIPFNRHIVTKTERGKGIVQYLTDYLLEAYKDDIPHVDALRLFNSKAKDGLWDYYKGLIKENGAVVLNASASFSINLQMSCFSWYRYKWVWYKNTPTGMPFAKYQPMRVFEDILVFYKKCPLFNKQPTTSLITDRKLGGRNGRGKALQSNHYNITKLGKDIKLKSNVSPRDVLQINSVPLATGRLHHNQKPLELVSYFIKTYSSPNDLILDNTAGSFTTGVSCIINNRRFIGIDNNLEYCEIGRERIIKAFINKGDTKSSKEVTTKKIYQISFKLT